MATPPDFHRDLGEAVRARGVSLSHLRERLVARGNPVSLATLSYWRSGRSRPEGAASLAAVDDLEVLLGLTRGALTSGLGPSRRSGSPGARAPVRDVVDQEAPLVEAALARLGLGGPPELVEDGLHVQVDVDASGCTREVAVDVVLRATRHGARRLPLVYVNADPLSAAPSISVAGGTLGSDASLPERGLVAREFVLDRALAQGESAVAQQRTRFHHRVGDTSYEHYLTRRLDTVTLWVRFDPARLPESVEGVRVSSDGVRSTQELPLGEAHGAQLVLRGFGPGRAGVSWTWGPAAGDVAPRPLSARAPAAAR